MKTTLNLTGMVLKSIRRANGVESPNEFTLEKFEVTFEGAPDEIIASIMQGTEQLKIVTPMIETITNKLIETIDKTQERKSNNDLSKFIDTKNNLELARADIRRLEQELKDLLSRDK